VAARLVTLRLSEDLVARADALLEKAATLPEAQAGAAMGTGARVTRSDVLRIALGRGLDTLERCVVQAPQACEEGRSPATPKGHPPGRKGAATARQAADKRRVYGGDEQRAILAEYVAAHGPFTAAWKWVPGLGKGDYFTRPNGERVKVRTIRSWRDRGVEPQ